MLFSINYRIVVLLRRRFIIFCVFFIGVAFLLIVSLLDSLEKQSHFGSIINISGKQRMLAQRIIYLTQNMLSLNLTKGEVILYTEELSETLNEFNAIHKNLQKQIQTFDNSLSLYNLYFGKLDLSHKIDSFLALGYQFLETHDIKQRHAIAKTLWLKWGGDLRQEVQTWTSDTIVINREVQIFPIQEGISGLLEVSTFNIQSLGEMYINETKRLLLWGIFGFVILLIACALLVVFPLLFTLASLFKYQKRK